MTEPTMETIVDKLVFDLNELANKPYGVGGFSDEMSLSDDVWFGEAPVAIGKESFPLIEVVPVLSEPAGGTTGKVNRDLTVRVTLIYDPQVYYDASETSEATASREAMRCMDSIEQYLEKTSKMRLDGLARSAVVGATEYVSSLPRGTLNVRSASATINVQIERTRSN